MSAIILTAAGVALLFAAVDFLRRESELYAVIFAMLGFFLTVASLGNIALFA